MRVRPLMAASAVLMTSLLLVGCTTAGVVSEHPTASRGTPSESSTPIAVATLVFSLEGVSATNNDGSTGGSAKFSDGPATVEFLAAALGSTPPAVHDDHYLFTSYDWGGVTLSVNDLNSSALLRISAPELGGVALQTAEGIHIGSTLAEVKAVASPGTEFASSGTSDVYYGLEARAHPGTESLAFPGRVGQDYIEVQLKDGVVVSLRTPFGDWQDV